MGEPQIEASDIEYGILSGIGNITNIQTWIDTYKTHNTTFGEGKGVMVSKNGMASWIGYGTGQIQNNSSILVKDVIFFSNDATGDLKFLNNLVGLKIKTVEGNTSTVKIWKWQ